jgi:hypothetical protein
MSTVVNLTEQELADLRELTRQADNEAAIRTAMGEFVRYARRMQLKTLSGKVQMDENWQELEAAELRNENGNSAIGSR